MRRKKNSVACRYVLMLRQVRAHDHNRSMGVGVGGQTNNDP